MACIRKRRGRWVVDYRDSSGARRWKTLETKWQAEDFLARVIPETRQRTRPAVNPTINLEDYSRRWLDLIAPSVKHRTLTSYHQTLRLHLLPAFGPIKVQHLDKGRVKTFLAEKLTGGLSRNTVRNHHAVLRAMLRAAVDDGIITVNPAEKLGRALRLVVSKATRQEEIKAFTREQRQRFLEVAARKEPRFYPLFFTLAGTGMRLSEALALQWSDLCLPAQEIRITRALSGGLLDTPKSGHGRTVDISKSLAQVLARLEVERKAVTLRRGWPQVPPWVSCNEAGHPMDEHKVRKVMTRTLKAANLPLHFSPHSLRHSYASLMLQQGESVAYIQRQLGHASIQLTVDTYGKWLPLGNKAAVDRLDEQSGSKVVANGVRDEGEEAKPLEKNGAGEWARTTDLRFTNYFVESLNATTDADYRESGVARQATTGHLSAIPQPHRNLPRPPHRPPRR